ncbi:MAG TPA: SDR family oxidoreductase [Bacteroidia bacterium]|jgi:dTDP-4-dehydrorhamnose reductase|nr:SDR family oxidoreductase [Bacteroidia bacterium]
MKTILITGSNGLLGQKLIYNLLARNRKSPSWNIIATSKGENRLIEKNGYTYVPFDITNISEVETVFAKYKPDVVINTAAMTNVDACESKKEEAKALNVDSVRYMVDTISNPKFQIENCQLIHLSTDFIFDGENGPYKEEDQPNPLSYYAQTKNDSEKVVRNSGIKNWCIVRTIIVYGIVDGMSRSNLVLWAKDALTKGQKINVVNDQFRSPTLAEDLAEGCMLCAEKNAHGVYHISGEKTESVLDLVYHVADFWKLDKSLITPSTSVGINQPAKRPPRTGFIIDKAKRELGYKPHSFMEGLAVLDTQLRMEN